MSPDAVTAHRHALNIHPVYKRVDSCAGEFPAVRPICIPVTRGMVVHRRTVKPILRIVKGYDSRRRSQSYPDKGLNLLLLCTCDVLRWPKRVMKLIMVNCNPETVSTDPDTADRLYFEPLTEEAVMNIVRTEQRQGHLKGVIVQLGANPLKLAHALENANIPSWGRVMPLLLLRKMKLFSRFAPGFRLATTVWRRGIIG